MITFIVSPGMHFSAAHLPVFEAGLFALLFVL
jgi:hypothetical protein